MLRHGLKNRFKSVSVFLVCVQAGPSCLALLVFPPRFSSCCSPSSLRAPGTCSSRMETRRKQRKVRKCDVAQLHIEDKLSIYGTVCISTVSTAAPAWVGRRGQRAVGDASGGPVREGRRSPECVLPAVPALSSLAADLHSRHEHGPAAVGCQCGETCPSSCPRPSHNNSGCMTTSMFLLIHRLSCYNHNAFLFSLRSTTMPTAYTALQESGRVTSSMSQWEREQ